MEAAEEELKRRRREAEEVAGKQQYDLRTFLAGPMLVGSIPNEEGWVPAIPYDGGQYDSSIFHVEATGWDHEHCWVCWARIEDGDSWWVAVPNDEVGLCKECHNRIFENR